MMTKAMKTITFDKINDQLWQEAAIKSLRGIPFDQLKTQTIEEIALEPIYTKSMYEAIFNTDDKAFHETIEKNIESAQWTIAQPVYAQTAEEYIQSLEESISRGNEAIYYVGHHDFNFGETHLKALAKLMVKYPVYILTDHHEADIFKTFDLINEGDRHSVTGVVTSNHLPHGYINLRRRLIDTKDEHLKGADAAQELALALAKLSESLNDYADFDQFQKDLAVRFATDTHFFTEIAKYRAFRILWDNFQQAFHATSVKMPILAETSERSYTKYDEYTNLLRAANETFASILSGVDVFTVHSHAALTDPSDRRAERIARNVQLVLKSETFSGHVIDPSKGSYYLDILTKELAEKAWEIFQTIEAEGGLEYYRQSGQLDQILSEKYQEKMKRLSQNKETLVGTTSYIDLSEAWQETKEDYRFASAFERLRARGAQANLQVILLRFGNLKQYKARADFVRGFLATAGIAAVDSPVFADAASANAWVKKQDPAYFVICSDLEGAYQLLSEVDGFKNHRLEIAGKYQGEALTKLESLGINGMIYYGQDKLEKLNRMIEEAE